MISTASGYRGSMVELYSRVEELAREELRGPLQIRFADRRNRRLDGFAREASYGLHEGARLGNYREVALTIDQLGEKYRLTEVGFAVDEHRLYLQGRDGDYYLYLVVEVGEPEGGVSDA